MLHAQEIQKLKKRHGSTSNRTRNTNDRIELTRTGFARARNGMLTLFATGNVDDEGLADMSRKHFSTHHLPPLMHFVYADAAASISGPNTE